jgi:hypothetical protein
MSIPAATGWQWLKQGSGLFRKQPAALITLLFANILVSVTLSALPWVGPMLVAVLIPAFSMSFMKACVMIDNGVRVTPVVLLTGFRQPAFAALAKVGLIYLGVSLVLALLARYAIDPMIVDQMQSPVDPKNAPQVPASSLLTILAIFMLQMAALMALSFAAPLTYWQKMGLGKATFYSFFAVVRNLRVFAVLLLSWCAIFLGMGMLTALIFGGGDMWRVVTLWMVFLFALLLQCSMYVGYRQIFGKPEDAEAAVRLKK